jgi:cytochrome c2
MSIYLLKSLLALLIALSAFAAMYTMFEVFGRNRPGIDVAKMTKLHKFNGIIYFIIFVIVSYFCLSFIVMTKSELSARSTLHGIFSFSILLLMGVKIAYIRVYRKFVSQVKIIGLLMALLTFGVVATSAGYYLLVSEAGTDKSFDKVMQYKKRQEQKSVQSAEGAMPFALESEEDGIERGGDIFESKCSFCHDAYSTEVSVGPGLKGILKNKKLPVSRRPATPENIIRQLKEPFSRMPSFEYLTEQEISDIIAYLKTL